MLSGSDTTFYLDEPVEPQHTLKVAVFDEQSSRDFDFERAVNAIAGAIDVLPQMQWRLHPVPFGLGRPAWVTDPGFDVRNHVYRARVPEPGTKAQLCRTISEITSEPVPPGRPPWELWFIEGYEGGKVVAALKMNHALADGGRLVELLDLLSHPDPGAPNAVPVPHAPEAITGVDALTASAAELANQVRHAVPRRLRSMWQARGGDPAPRTPSLMREQPKLPWRGPLTPGRCFSWVSVPLDDVRAMAHAVSGTVNAVVFAIAAGAIREYLLAEGMPTDRPVVGNAAAKVHGEGDGRLWGTTATNRTFALPTHLADPLARLQEAQVQTRAVRASVDSRPVQREEWFDLAPAVVLRPMLRFARMMGRWMNGAVIVSNVMGPHEKRYIGPVGIENFISCGHLKYVAGLNITVWSYDKNLNFAVYGCSRTLHDAELFTQRLQSAFEELREATGIATT
ncbi:MAG TPA: wax ester/triacylglycerol synthase domain-containing protein [Mycobacterium sp.]|nr:wax ester/triacylglycerol synthase domain-containing protein [Mycobacterium sp.]